QSLASECCHEGRVDSTGETEDRCFETILPRVVAYAEYESSLNGLAVIARQAMIVEHTALEINGAKELFEWRRLKNNLAEAISNYAGAVEDNSVIAANEIDEHYWKAGAPCAMR